MTHSDAPATQETIEKPRVQWGRWLTLNQWVPVGIVALADWTAVAGFFWLIGCFTGAACGNRTRDLLITSETLYQLS